MPRVGLASVKSPLEKESVVDTNDLHSSDESMDYGTDTPEQSSMWTSEWEKSEHGREGMSENE